MGAKRVQEQELDIQIVLRGHLGGGVGLPALEVVLVPAPFLQHLHKVPRQQVLLYESSVDHSRLHPIPVVEVERNHLSRPQKLGWCPEEDADRLSQPAAGDLLFVFGQRH